jgi:hypothetical protein
MSMDIGIEIIIGFLIIHWIADFICQSDKMAKGKSSSWKCLLSHTATYSFIWFIVMGIQCRMYNIDIDTTVNLVVFFPLITFFCHTMTDYITSREVKKLFEKGDTHNGFVVIGFDQILHYVQLFLTYLLLT